MPALEIMPMCGNMDEAQRRAHLPLPPRQNRRKSEAEEDDDDNNDNTVPVAQPPPQQQEHHHHHHHAPITSPTRIASKKIVRFLRRFRRRRSSTSSSSNSNKNGNGTETTTTTSDATPTNTPTAKTADREVSITSISPLLDHHGEEDKSTSETEHMDEHEDSTSSAIGFSAIGVKYWGKILEDEEEEPPEAYMGSMWNE